jgi:hypothetical protein
MMKFRRARTQGDDGSRDVFGEGRSGIDVLQDLVGKDVWNSPVQNLVGGLRISRARVGPIFAPMLQRFITSFPPTPQERRWEEVYDEVAAREMEIFNALADGSALEQVPRGGGKP